MKTIILTSILSFALGNVAMAEEKAPATPTTQEKTTEAPKKTRKKKVEMCGECGKPEHQCECGHKEKEEEKK